MVSNNLFTLNPKIIEKLTAFTMILPFSFFFRTTDEEPKSRTTPQLTTTTEKSTIITDEITGDFFSEKNKNPQKKMIHQIILTISVEALR